MLETAQTRSVIAGQGEVLSRRIVVAAAAVALLFGLVAAWKGYDGLVSRDQAVRAQWGQVDGAYQRRAELIPGLTQVAKDAAGFERAAMATVAGAQARAHQVSALGAARLLEDRGAFQAFEQAQRGLDEAVSQLMAAARRDPDLRMTTALPALESRLEAAETRIANERLRFNEVAQQFNTRRQSLPTALVAALAGSRFDEKPYFQSPPRIVGK